MSNTDVVSHKLIGQKFGCCGKSVSGWSCLDVQDDIFQQSYWTCPSSVVSVYIEIFWNLKKKKFLFHMFILGGVQLALLHCTFSHLIENKTYLSLVGFSLSNNTNSKRCDPAHLKYVVEVTPHVSAPWATETRARPQICCRYTRESESDIDSNQLCTCPVQCEHEILSIKKGAFSHEDKSLSVTLNLNTQKHKIVAHRAPCHHFVLL